MALPKQEHSRHDESWRRQTVRAVDSREEGGVLRDVDVGGRVPLQSFLFVSVTDKTALLLHPQTYNSIT